MLAPFATCSWVALPTIFLVFRGEFRHGFMAFKGSLEL